MVGEKKEIDVLMWLSALLLCSYQMICAASTAQQDRIYFNEATVVETIYEGNTLYRNVCPDFSSQSEDEVSFYLTASPSTSDLQLPTNVRITRSCVIVAVRSWTNYVKEDTKTFLIILRTQSSTVGVDENRGRFTLYVRDTDYDNTADSCPTPAVVFNGHEVSCSNNYAYRSYCNYECRDGFERLSGDSSRTCNFNLRWSGLPLFCIQIVDECSQGTHNCFSNASCANAVGSFTCTCPTGYSGDGSTCTDIDECQNYGQHNCEYTSSKCVDTEGSYHCECKDGYTGEIYSSGQTSTCIDINECSSNNGNCPSSATCDNNDGSFTCICPTGYSYDGATCVDNTPPTISDCPERSINVYIAIDQTQGEATWTEPTASDASGSVTVSPSHSPGESFPVGSTQVRYEFRDRFNNMEECQFLVYVYTVDIICPSPITVSYRGVLSYTSPQCTINYGWTSGTSRSSCTPQDGTRAEEDVLGVCRCYTAPHITCNFRITVQASVQCPSQMTISPGEMLSYDIPQCMNHQGSHPASCLPSTGSSVTTYTSVTCSCLQDESIQCSFQILIVDIICPSPITVSYRSVLSYTSPQCTINYGRTSGTSRSSCTPQDGTRAEEDVLGVCTCYTAPHITCNFQITVQTRVRCPSSKTIAPGEILSYNIPLCRNSQGSRQASCFPSTGSSVSTDTSVLSVTCSCPQDDSIQCSFDIFVDCIALEDTICGNSGVMCGCMDESCDPDTGICSSNCTIVTTCPASIESVSFSQVNPSSSVNITCTLRGSRAILQGLQLRLSRESHALRQAGITKLKGSEANTDQVQSTFRVENVTKENTLYCVLFQKITDERRVLIGRVSVTDFVHELPNLNAAPIHEGVSNTTVTISWRAWDPAMDDGDPPIVAYIPYYRKDASDEWISGPRILTNETLYFKADSLEVDTLYDFSVAVVREGENGEGPRSQPVAVKTLCNVPGVAASVNVQLTSSNKVNVSWQLPPGEMMCSTGVTSYKVYYKIEGSTDDTPQLAVTVEDVDRRWFIVDDGLLEPGSSYIFYVTVHTDQESGLSESQAIESPAGSPAGTIVAVICIIVLLIILLLVILVIIKRKRDEKADGSNPAPKYVDSTSDNFFGNPVESRQGAEAASAAKPVFQMPLAKRGDHEKISLESFCVEEGTSSDEAIYGNLEPPQPIRVSEFKDYFKQNIDKFEQEFSILKGSKKQFDWTVAEDPVNKKKNRFKNIYTYDHSRVVLKTVSDQEGSDYYNASFIKNADGVIAYIASQAPNKASLEDFIRMIWEQNVTTIVMVANIYEDGKERCHQYWPETEGSHKSFGSVTVTWLKTTKCSDFVVRYFSFKKGKKSHEVQQLHFLTWPDKDTPEYGTALIEFTKQSKLLHHGKKYPMLVHCSAGIGRTGTFICLSCMMDALRDKEYIDVFGFVNKMRQNRVNMVQTSKQYVFLYKCLNEYHLTHQTEISVREMTRLDVESHRGILLGEFELLSELVHNPHKNTDENCAGKKRENIVRNRVRNMVPSNKNRVFLMSPGRSNDGNYINASYVKSFQKKDAFILTQSPLPYTTEDFWRMVYDVKSPLVVMLNQLDPTDTTCLQYWPDHGSTDYGNMHITYMSTDEEPSSYIQRTFDVKHVNSKEVLSVTHMQMKEWHPDTNLESIVSLFKDVDMMHKRGQYTQPIVIHCINGFDRSGVMVTVISELERIAVTERIDVFSTVKKLRDQHEHMLKNKDDYILCYHLLKAYLTSSNNSDYENLQDVRRK